MYKTKAAHNRQENIISELIKKLEEEANNESSLLNKYIYEGYDNLIESVTKYGFKIPSK